MRKLREKVEWESWASRVQKIEKEIDEEMERGSWVRN